MMSEWNGDWEGDRNRACSSLLELFTVCFKILKKTCSHNLSKTVFLFASRKFSVFIFHVWLKWNWQISKLKNTTNFERKYGALFIPPKPRLLNFRELPVANRAAFLKISRKEDNLAWYTQILEKFSRKYSFRASLHAKISRNFGWVVRISEIQPFPGFLKLFREISVPFAAVSKVSKVLVELKAPMVYAWCTVFPRHFLREKPSEWALRNSR